MKLFSLLAITLLTTISLAACTASFTQQKYYDPAKSHHTKTGFQNPPGSPVREFAPFRFINFILKRVTDDYDQSILPDGHVLDTDEVQKKFAAAPKDARITWIGHAGFLIGLNGLNILTDPHFSERASPLSFIGPKRFIPPGMMIKDLPKIDVILISHNHYDAFDEKSFRELAEHSPEARVLVPLGDGPLAKEWGMKNVEELDWYNTVQIGRVTFQSTPTLHRSNRGLFDVNSSLWQGFTISGEIDGKTKKIWFVGDTGLGPFFKQEVAQKVGPVDIALIPNGAFLPRNIMKWSHVSPAEALELAKIMGAKTVIPMHWGTFPLGEDLPKLGKARFLAVPASGIKKVLMRIGETLDLSKL
jgi:N-acyl-phosphatidylethanolamine-hydrolysing phospholipase D